MNSYLKPFPGLRVTARIYNLDMSVKFSKEARADIAENSTARVFELPEIRSLSPTYFVDLILTDAGGIP